MEKGKIYLGIVEDNVDPIKEQRCKIMVVNVFDGLETDDIPWAYPEKDVNGNTFNVPDIGKVVTTYFENDDIYTPIYKYADHHNINLSEKLKSLSDDDYTSMKSLLFDHLTQIYRNDGEGLTLDHKFNKATILDDSINLELKDNFGSVNIGSRDASQQAILGNNFLDWFDGFVSQLLGEGGGPYYGNLLSPILPHPELISHLLKYKAMKDPKFLSHNVNFNDNGYVQKLDRVNITQTGDNWVSTKDDNTFSSQVNADYLPKSGSKDVTPDDINTPSEERGGSNIPQEDINLDELGDGDIHDDILILIDVMNKKDYIVNQEPFKLNIVGVRYQYPGEDYTNRFVDKLYVFYIDDKGEWVIKNYKISTMPGTRIKISNKKFKKLKNASRDIIGKRISLKKYAQYLGRSGLGILQPSQYVNMFKLDKFISKPALKCVGKQLAYRDNNWDSDEITYGFEDEGYFGMHIHRGFPGGSVVNNWSEGCQVFSSERDLLHFEGLCKLHIQKHDNKFTYTLITSKDFEESREEIDNRDI